MYKHVFTRTGDDNDTEDPEIGTGKDEIISGIFSPRNKVSLSRRGFLAYTSKSLVLAVVAWVHHQHRRQLSQTVLLLLLLLFIVIFIIVLLFVNVIGILLVFQLYNIVVNIKLLIFKKYIIFLDC